MAKYHLTNKAVEDLAEIWNYTCDEWSEKQADTYYLLLLSSCQEIAEKPKRGKKYDVVSEKLLGYKSNEHIIFYIILSKKEIEVIRILHGRMDLKSKL
jgi:toxin ParE1/3/4